jgi:hypothetical protein
LGHIQKQFSGSVFGKKLQKLLIGNRNFFLGLNVLVKMTGHTGPAFFSERPLNFSPAAGTGYRPAYSSGVFAVVDPIERFR